MKMWFLLFCVYEGFLSETPQTNALLYHNQLYGLLI